MYKERPFLCYAANPPYPLYKNLLYGLQNSLSVFCCLQADLLSDDVSVLPLHAGSCFRLGLYAQKLILVPQLHLVLYRGCEDPTRQTARERPARHPHPLRHPAAVVTGTYLFSWPPVSGQTPPVCEGFPHSGLAVEK